MNPLIGLKLTLSIESLLMRIISNILGISLSNIELSINERLMLIFIPFILIFLLEIEEL
jgi:hypothetical protein